MRLLPLLMSLALTGCAATAGPPRVAVCDGKHTRPANPYGSVLDAAPLAAPTTAPTVAPALGSKAPSVASPPLSKEKAAPLSAIDPRSTQPCGRLA